MKEEKRWRSNPIRYWGCSVKTSPGTAIKVQFRDGHVEIEPLGGITVEKRGRFFVAVDPSDTPPVEPSAVDEFLDDLREGRICYGRLSSPTVSTPNARARDQVCADPVISGGNERGWSSVGSRSWPENRRRSTRHRLRSRTQSLDRTHCALGAPAPKRCWQSRNTKGWGHWVGGRR